MAEAILAAELAEGDAITISYKEGDKNLTFKTKKAKKPAATSGGTGSADSSAHEDEPSADGSPDEPGESSPGAAEAPSDS